jgi:hypothetical protein
MHDKYKKAHRTPAADDRLRRNIATEAARRLIALKPPDDPVWLDALSDADLYTAKRKAAAVLGRKVRPGDLPSDIELRAQVLLLLKSGEVIEPINVEESETEPESDPDVGRMADHLDRFTYYKLRLEPLEAFKQNPKTHPEGDALFHSLQVFEIAREARPYDEEFLLAALLHDIGKAIEISDHITAGVEALRGAVTERTLWLIEHHHDLDDNPRARLGYESPERREDLRLLHECNRNGRVPGRPVEGIDASIAYLKSLEREDYLKDQI